MSIEVLIFIVCLLSVIVELLFCAFSSVAVRMLSAVAVPFIVAVGIYWLPHLSEWHNGEYRSWFPIFFILSFIPAVVASSATAVLVGWVQHRKVKDLRRGPAQQ